MYQISLIRWVYRPFIHRTNASLDLWWYSDVHVPCDSPTWKIPRSTVLRTIYETLGVQSIPPSRDRRGRSGVAGRAWSRRSTNQSSVHDRRGSSPMRMKGGTLRANHVSFFAREWVAPSAPRPPELRVAQHFSTFYGSSVQAMDTQLGAASTESTGQPQLCSIHCEGASTKARRTCRLTTAPSTPGGPIRGCRRPRSRVSRSAQLASECR